MNTLYKNTLFATLLAGLFFMTACNNDDDAIQAPTYDIPSTYSAFENVSYQGQTDRLSMMTEWKSYMSTSRTQGVALDAERMKKMFANDEGAEFTQAYTKQIKSKTFESEQVIFEALIDELALASQSAQPGFEGQAGVIESLDGAKSYLVGADGLDHAQVIEKGLMGACFYYQGTSVYFGADRMNVDNETVTAGEGTEMEHHWDEAFGYFGVPKEFPTNTDGLSFWGNYSDKRNAVLNSNQLSMDAFLKGRAAISNDDLATRDEAIEEARDIWELIAVGSALHYINDGIANFNDIALRSHSLSEAIGFIYSLQFNETKKINNTQVGELLTLVGGASQFADMNLYNITEADLTAAKDNLAAYYDLEAQKNDF